MNKLRFLTEGERKTLPLFLLSLAVYVPSAIYLLIKSSVWGDEIFTWDVIRGGWADVFVEVARDVHPPLYWLLLKFFYFLFPFGFYSLRFFSLLCGAAALYLAWRLSEERNFSPVIVLIMGTSPIFLEGTVWARYYSLVLFAWLLVLRYEEKLFGSPLKTALVVGTAGYLDYLLMLAVSLRALFKKGRRALWGIGGGFVVFLPWMVVVFFQIQRRGSTGPFLSIIKKIAFALYAFGVGENGVPLDPGVFFGLLAFSIFLLWGSVVLREESLFLGTALVLSAYLLTRFAYVGDEFFPFRVFFLFPLLLHPLTRGMSEAASKGKWAYVLVALYFWGLVSGYWHLMRREEFLNSAYYFPASEFVRLVEEETPEAVLSVTPAAKFYAPESVKFFLVSDPRGREECLKYLRENTPEKLLFVGSAKWDSRLADFLDLLKVSYIVSARLTLLEESQRVTAFKRILGIKTGKNKFYVIVLEFKPLEGNEISY